MVHTINKSSSQINSYVQKVYKQVDQDLRFFVPYHEKSTPLCIHIIDHEKSASTAIVASSTCQPLNLSLKNKLTQGFENFFEASY